MTELPLDEARAFAKAFVDLSQLAHRVLLLRNDLLATRLRTHLGLAEGTVAASTSVSWPVVDRPNLQRALDEMSTTRPWQVVGLSGDVGHYGGVSAAAMVSGTWDGPGEGPPQFEAMEVGIDGLLLYGPARVTDTAAHAPTARGIARGGVDGDARPRHTDPAAQPGSSRH